MTRLSIKQITGTQMPQVEYVMMKAQKSITASIWRGETLLIKRVILHSVKGNKGKKQMLS